MASVSCSEPHHTKGPPPKPCRICSMPVCEGCIVKASFAKVELTLHMCRAHFCIACWGSGQPPRERRPSESVDKKTERFCDCSAQDKWLCLRCKQARRRFSESSMVQCEGQDCSTIMESGRYSSITCLLCGLESRPGRERFQRQYDSIHLSARFNSAVDFAIADDENGEAETETTEQMRTDVSSTFSTEVSRLCCPVGRAIPEVRGVEMHQICSAFDYGASQLESRRDVEAEASAQSGMDPKENMSSPEFFQEKSPSGPFGEKVEIERPTAGRMKVLRAMWRRADMIRSRLRVFHSPKAILRGYSRI